MDQKTVDNAVGHIDTYKNNNRISEKFRRATALVCLLSFLLGAPLEAFAAVDYEELQEDPLDTMFRKLAPSGSINWDDEEELVGGGAPDIVKGMAWPLKIGVLRGLFNRYRSRGHRKHHGIDIIAPKGTPIHAALGGTVEVVSNGGKGFRGYGKVLIINHNGKLWSLYSHCSTMNVRIGQRVRQGDVIASVGRTGRATANHLHFEVRNGNGYPLNPLKYLPKTSTLSMPADTARRMYAENRAENAARRSSRKHSVSRSSRAHRAKVSKAAVKKAAVKKTVSKGRSAKSAKKK